MKSLVLFFVTFISLFSSSFAQSTCSASSPCRTGCCNGQTGNCGFGPDFCGSACISNCNATAECGQYAAAGATTCPLNVCCSKYGFCGTTSEFCGDGCQNGCSPVRTPSCGGASSSAKYIGYYESWNTGRACDTITPDQIDPTPWTHLSYAFALIGSDNTIIPMNSYDTSNYPLFNGLKQKKPSLKTFISVGGWDAGGTVFSNMCMHTQTRSTFINSAIAFMKQYGFDGIDIDWEYPVADDRGGNPADKGNFVQFLKEFRAAAGSNYLITATLPSSYWYLRGFDIVSMTQYLDWFNFMSYDIHGTWDGNSPYTRKVVQPHTNLTEISDGLSLLWRNRIPPSKVTLGLGFYGRSFTLASSGCNRVNCPFSAGGSPGTCTGVSGTLSNYEMARIMNTENPIKSYDSVAGVNWMTWGGNQWVSYDDGHTLNQKAKFADGLCLSGLFSWALDLGGPGTAGDPHNTTGTDLNGYSPGSGQVISISPDIWNQPNPTITCAPPCTFVLPPKTLSTLTTITFPPYTTSLEVAWSTSYYVTSSGQTLLTTTIGRTIQPTTLTFPPLTTSIIPVWNWPVTDTNTKSATYTLSSSILPPRITITDDPNPLKSPGVSHPPVTRTITPPPYPWPSSQGGSTTSSSTTTGAALIPIFFTAGPKPGPLCTSGCGTLCLIFCGGPCLLNCGGGDFPDPIDPNPPGCSGPDCVNGRCKGPKCINGGCTGPDCVSGSCNGPKCTSGGCSGPDCVAGVCAGVNCCYGPGCEDGKCFGSQCVQGGQNDGDKGCTSQSSAPVCTETVSSFKSIKGGSTATTFDSTTITNCRTLTGCNIRASTSTTTTTDDPKCPLYTPDSSFPFGYDAEGPNFSRITIANTDPIYITGANGGNTITIQPDGVSTVTITTTVTPTTTITETVTVTPTAHADCAFWDEALFWTFEVYNIQNWSNDGGEGLKKQEKGCGALTGWSYEETNSDHWARAYFNLPFFMKAGCVERAIVSAGGPKIACQGQGIDFKRRRREALDAGMTPDEFWETEQERKRIEVAKFEAEEALRAEMQKGDLRKRATSDGPARPTAKGSPSYSYSTTAASHPYNPQNWTGIGDTVTFTWTFTNTYTSSYFSLSPINYNTTTTSASTNSTNTATKTGSTVTSTVSLTSARTTTSTSTVTKK